MVLLEAAPDGVDLVGNPTPKHSSSFGPYEPAEWVEAAELTEESTDASGKSVEEWTDDAAAESIKESTDDAAAETAQKLADEATTEEWADEATETAEEMD